MLVEYVSRLANKRVILASASPRRRELLTQIGLKFKVLPSTFEETLPKDQFSSGADYALATAKHKALDVAAVCKHDTTEELPDLIISADTVVEHNGLYLEKPSDADDAATMLTRLSGDKHHVHTGVVLVVPSLTTPDGWLTREFACTTVVRFDKLTPAAILGYIATGEPFGKAGAYGIQGVAGSFVKGIEGCYFNVVGLPINRLSAEIVDLCNLGLIKLDSP